MPKTLLMSATDFISKMVEETLRKEQAQGEQVLPFHQPDCFEVEAIYSAEKKCYMIEANNLSIEIPKNWGPFKNRIASEFILSTSDDKEMFLDVVSSFFNRKIDCLKIRLVDAENHLSEFKKSA